MLRHTAWRAGKQWEVRQRGQRGVQLARWESVTAAHALAAIASSAEVT